MPKKLLTIACVIVLAACLVNFVTFVVGSERLGGDALNGHQSDGRFFVSAHGRSTEVDESAWRSSRLHAISVLASWAVAMIAMVYLALRFVGPRFLYRAGSDAISTTELRVRTSGPALSERRCGGRIGKINFSTPLLRVAVYRSGLWIKPAFMNAFAVSTDDLRSIDQDRGVVSKRTHIVHGSAEIASPIVLYCGADEPLAAELKRLVSER
jgi:hypothetical protein